MIITLEGRPLYQDIFSLPALAAVSRRGGYTEVKYREGTLSVELVHSEFFLSANPSALSALKKNSPSYIEANPEVKCMRFG
jgi:hypothetical protein